MNDEHIQQLLESVNEPDRRQHLKLNLILFFIIITALTVVTGFAMTTPEPWLTAFLFVVATAIGIVGITSK